MYTKDLLLTYMLWVSWADSKENEMCEAEDRFASFSEALEQAAAGHVDHALTTLSKRSTSRSDLSIEYEDHVSFESDGSSRYTTLRRDYSLICVGKAVVTWWEEYIGYRGSMGAGWFIETVDQSGPPDGLTALLSALDIKFPDLDLPRPD